MRNLVELALSFPNVVFTALLSVVLLYWVFVLFGALDIELFEADADLDVDLDVDADVDADADGITESSGSSLASALKSLGLSGVPVTIVFSVVVLVAWTLSMLLSGPAWTALVGVPVGVMAAIGIGSVALALAVPVSSLATRPLRGVFTTHQAPRRKSLIGRKCRIATNKVTGVFGQAEIEDGGAGFLVQVRCTRFNQLRKGSEAVVFDWDDDLDAFLVAPFGDTGMPEGLR